MIIQYEVGIMTIWGGNHEYMTWESNVNKYLVQGLGGHHEQILLEIFFEYRKKIVIVHMIGQVMICLFILQIIDV